MLTQVFMNLIKNAIEAMDKDESGRKHLLVLSLREELRNGKPYVVAGFQDNGPGISKALLNRIFDFGFSTKGTEKTRGFGLAFCMNTIKRYHGVIEVDSTPGEGTIFRVFLPVEENLH
jgi:signal transduction histidine kinase